MGSSYSVTAIFDTQGNHQPLHILPLSHTVPESRFSHCSETKPTTKSISTPLELWQQSCEMCVIFIQQAENIQNILPS